MKCARCGKVRPDAPVAVKFSGNTAKLTKPILVAEVCNCEVYGLQQIQAERAKQVEKWSHHHDDEHDGGEIAFNAMMLIVEHLNQTAVEKATESVEVRVGGDDVWVDQWGLMKRHRDDRIKLLTVAGALVAAEIDRLRREEERKTEAKIDGE